jgi:antitoxin CptB
VQSDTAYTRAGRGAAAGTDEDLRRLRWRCRRGLLENDLLIGRFLDSHGERLEAPHREALQAMLELPEADLLDLFLCRGELPAALDSAAGREVLHWMRSA